MATVTERLNAVETRLDEASTELLAEIEKLKEENLSPEGEATLGRIESKVTGLADVVQNPAPPAEPPAEPPV